MPAQGPTATVVRLRNWVGDVVLGVPALRLLAAHGHTLTLVGKGWAPALLAGEGWPVLVRPGPLRARVAQLAQWRREAARAGPSTQRAGALVLPQSFSSALEMRLAGLGAVGYAAEGRSLLLARALPAPAAPEHMLHSYWRLACAMVGVQAPPPTRIDLRTQAQHQAEADALLAAHGLVPGHFAVIVPFAGGLFEKQEKTWPQFPEFTRALAAELQLSGRRIVVCPGPGEEPVAHSQHAAALCLPGVRMGVYGGLLRRAGVVVSNDTGPAHLAAAVGAPLVSVLGPTLPELWGPIGPRVNVVRHWPRWPTVDEVMAATLARWDGELAANA